jgi:hypothetical protein
MDTYGVLVEKRSDTHIAFVSFSRAFTADSRMKQMHRW